MSKRKDFHSHPMVQAVIKAHADPHAGLRTLSVMIRQASAEGRLEDEHVLADNFVTAACSAKDLLGTAERFARRLATRLPDRYHYQKLAAVLSLRGKHQESRRVRRQAARLPDLHSSPDVEQAIREAERELDD
jgi:hypothetical protein